MIIIKDWKITAPDDILGYQFDNNTRAIVVSGVVPDGWEWVALVSIGNNLDIINLSEVDADGNLFAILNRNQLAFEGVYTIQLRATMGDSVAHTNQIRMHVPGSLSGDAKWPTIPSEFTDLEKRVRELAKQAAESAVHSESWAVGGTGTRPGEDIDNAKYYAEKAKEEADGAKDHSKLYNRDKPDQHPIGAISGLQQALDAKQPTGEYLTTEDVSQTVGTEPDKVPSNKAVSDALDKKFDKSSVSDTVSNDANTVPSNKAVSDALDKKFDKANVADAVKNDANTVPSNKAVWDELGKAEYRNLIVNVEQTGLGFRADYKASEILNFADSGGTVEMHYNGSVFPFIGREQGQAVFRVPQVTATEVKSLGAKVQENYYIVVEDILYTPSADNTSAVVPAGLPDGTQGNVQDVLNAMQTQAGDLEHDKFGIIRVAVDREITQPIIAEIIANYANYEGQIIEFLANGDTPSRTIAYGFAMMDGGNQYVVVVNLDGTLTQWNKTAHEDHNFECKSFVNEMCDLDNLTIDVQGDAPFLASVRDAFNRPERDKTSIYGTCTTIAYAVDKQIQLYRDMESGKEWYRLISGQADRHSFGTWEVVGLSKEYVDSAINEYRQEANNAFANTLKAEAVGQTVVAENMSPLKHLIKCNLKSKNIYGGLGNSVGTFGTIYSFGDGQYRANVKDGYYAGFWLPESFWDVKKYRGKYLTLSFESDFSKPDFKTQITLFGQFPNSGSFISSEAKYDSHKVTIKIPENALSISGAELRILASGLKFTDNTTVFYDLQLEVSAIRTAYTPYISDFSNVLLYATGKNLLNPDAFLKSGFTEDGENQYFINSGTFAKGKAILTNPTKIGGTYGIRFWVKYSAGEAVGVFPVAVYTDGTRQEILPDRIESGKFAKVTAFSYSEKIVDRIEWDYKNELVSTRFSEFEVISGDNFDEEFQPFFANVYQTSASGAVDGVFSVGNKMTFITQNPGVLINILYNQDTEQIKKNVENLEKDVSAIMLNEERLNLIEHISFQESVSFSRDKTPDGIPYQFKNVYVKYKLPKDGFADFADLNIQSGTKRILYSNTKPESSEFEWGCMALRFKESFLDVDTGTKKTDSVTFGSSKLLNYAFIANPAEPINGAITLIRSYQPMPIGSEVWIYAN